MEKPYFVHESSYVDPGVMIGPGTKIWHFCHIMEGSVIGSNCTLGQGVNVDAAVVGNGVKIQNNVSIFSGVVIEDDVFLGPSCVFTNISNPRAAISRRGDYEKTILRHGCTIGANATILCGLEIGCYAFVGAGAVVTKNVPDYALVLGNPARQRGWVGQHGYRLNGPDAAGLWLCPYSGWQYRQQERGGLQKC